MRLNMPVTQKEVELKDGETIVSKTDTKGVITYCNQTFLDISGFTKDEVIGKPHNLLRHPDMPPGAFEDLWSTLKSGSPWSGMIKNRCKNGDYYWVHADVSPVVEAGKVTGFMSVRFKPERSLVDAAEKLYKSMREGHARGVAMRRGELVPTGLIGSAIHKFLNLSIKARLMMVTGLMSVLLATVGGVGLYAISEGNSALLAVYADGATPVGQPPATNKKAQGSQVLIESTMAQSTPDKKQDYEAAVSRSESARNLMIAIIVFGIIAAIALGGWLMLVINRAIAHATFIAESVSRGNLNLGINSSPSGEMGKLTDALRVMMQALRGFESAQYEIARRHEIGEISYKLPEEQFQGSYGKMAAGVNALAQSHIAIKMKLVSVIQHYAVGDFSVDMEKLPGEKAVITAACVEAKRNLVAMKDQIAELSTAASHGDFTQRGNAAQFDHSFQEMVQSLNVLMETADGGLSDTCRVLSAMARGDLTEKITANYEGAFGQLKDDANTTAGNLTDMVGKLRDATESINTAAKEIASGNTDLSQRTEEQASSLEETASSMEELTSTVKQNAENAKQANQLAIGASEVAVRGGDVVSQVVTTMSSINESSKKIVDIISVIDGIAFQTNILALNAAVEAARAGEQGRGFAVVATEVRNLAQRSAAAAKEIKTLIGDSVEKVGTGTKLVDEAGKTMAEIVSSVKRVTDIMGEITAASQEQSTGIEQVNQAITQMDEVTQQNAALVEQAAAAAESLEEQAQVLSQAVGVFKLDTSARSGHVVAHKPAATRPASVSQLPKRGKPQPAKASAPRAKVAAGGGSDDWSEF